MDQKIAYEWHPIAPLPDGLRSSRHEDLHSLLAVWAEERDSLAQSSSLTRFNERLQREWAIETGIIERIYTLDRGVTRLLIERGIDASLIPHDATAEGSQFVADIINDHQSAVGWLFDVVSQGRPLSVGFIKELHALMTHRQEFAEGRDQFGRNAKTKLRHGEFKRRPNNPERSDGAGEHQYCPPEQVDSEMDHLVELYQGYEDEGVAPEVASAWLHHRFTQVHPFQDGNGRVARALASLVTIRGGMFPLVVRSDDDRDTYIRALEQADNGVLDGLVDQFAAIQRRQFVAALGISREIRQDSERVDQVLESISDMFRHARQRASGAIRSGQSHRDSRSQSSH